MELLPRIRLAQKVIHSGLKSFFTIAVHGVCRQGDDGNPALPPFPFTPAERPGCFIAVHERHLTIHQNHIAIRPINDPEHFHPVRNGRRVTAESREHFFTNHLVDLIVLCQQYSEVQQEVLMRRCLPSVAPLSRSSMAVPCMKAWLMQASNRDCRMGFRISQIFGRPSLTPFRRVGTMRRTGMSFQRTSSCKARRTMEPEKPVISSSSKMRSQSFRPSALLSDRSAATPSSTSTGIHLPAQ